MSKRISLGYSFVNTFHTSVDSNSIEFSDCHQIYLNRKITSLISFRTIRLTARRLFLYIHNNRTLFITWHFMQFDHIKLTCWAFYWFRVQAKSVEMGNMRFGMLSNKIRAKSTRSMTMKALQFSIHKIKSFMECRKSFKLSYRQRRDCDMIKSLEKWLNRRYKLKVLENEYKYDHPLIP